MSKMFNVTLKRLSLYAYNPMTNQLEHHESPFAVGVVHGEPGVDVRVWPIKADTIEQVKEFFKNTMQPEGVPLQKGASFMVTGISPA